MCVTIIARRILGFDPGGIFLPQGRDAPLTPEGGHFEKILSLVICTELRHQFKDVNPELGVALASSERRI